MFNIYTYKYVYIYIYSTLSIYRHHRESGIVPVYRECRYIDLTENKEYMKKNIKYYVYYYNGIK